MKKLIALFTIALSTTSMAGIALSNTSMASTSIQSGSVIDTYKTVIKQIPYRVQKSGDGSATNELVGALFGGAIGNSFGKGDGKDAMTLFGALMGASLAHDDEVAKGPTRTVTVCDVQTRYEEEVSEVYSHSTITFRLEGRNYSLDFLK